MADDDNGANEPGPAGAASQGPQAAGQSQSSNVDFSGFDDEHVLEYVNDISADYNLYVAFLKKGAETAATRVTELTLKARKWRFWLIWLAGGVAILNTMAAFSLFTNYSLGSFPSAETGGDFNVTIAVIFTIIPPSGMPDSRWGFPSGPISDSMW